MKKFFKNFLALIMVTLLAFSLIACETQNNENNSGNNSSSGSGGNGGGNTEQQEGVLATLGDNYKIDLTYSAVQYGEPITEHEVFMAGSGARLYRHFYEDDGERTLLIKNERGYSFNEYVDLFSSCTTIDLERDVQFYKGWERLIRVSNNAQKIEFTSQENVTYLNRPCTKYLNKRHVDNDFVADYDVDAYYIVDNATKLCLKYDNTTKYYNDLGAVSNETTENFEVTEFAVGSVNMNNYLSKIPFEEWVTNDFLSSKSLTSVSKPSGTFINYHLNCDEKQKTILSYSCTYLMTEEKVNALCQALYNAGVKYGYDNFTTVKPIEEIYRESTDEYGNPVDGYIVFQGYTSTEAYVNVYGEQQEDGNYEMEISIG